MNSVIQLLMDACILLLGVSVLFILRSLHHINASIASMNRTDTLILDMITDREDDDQGGA